VNKSFCKIYYELLTDYSFCEDLLCVLRNFFLTILPADRPRRDTHNCSRIYRICVCHNRV